MLKQFCSDLASAINLDQITVKEIVFGFLSDPVPRYRHRLLVWRASTVSFLSHFREVAIKNAEQSHHPV